MFASLAGVHIINIKRTWEKLLLAARVIVSIENPADVCVISARPYGQVLCNAAFSFELCYVHYLFNHLTMNKLPTLPPTGVHKKTKRNVDYHFFS